MSPSARRRETRVQVVGGVLFLALLGVTLPRLEVDLELSAFVLGEEDSALAELSRQVAKSEASRTLVALVKGPSPRASLEAARALEARLRAQPEVMARIERLEGGPPAGMDEAVWRLYRPRLLGFAATSSAAALDLVSPAGLDAAFADLQDRLRTPASALLARVAPEDPLLILPRLLDRLAAAGQGGVRVAGGRYLSRSGYGVLFLRTRASAFRGEAHAPLLRALRDALPDEAGLELELGGLHRFAVAVQRSIEADIRRVSILSTLALLALVLVLFRSPLIAGLVLLVVGAGLVVGLAVTVAAEGRVHGLTLAFGASLIGVAVDYAVHFFVHHTVEGEGRDPRRLLRELSPGLILGALTTVVGFVALGVSSLPGLAQVALFAASGIGGALLATGMFLPGAVAQTPHRRRPSRLAGALDRGMGAVLAGSRGPLLLVPALALGLGLLGWPSVQWGDDVAGLARLDPELVEEEEEVRAEVTPFEQRRFVVATGTSAASALEANDRVAAALRSATATGGLGGFRSLADLLPSPRTQRAVAEAIRSRPDLPGHLRAAAEARGFRPEAFAAFERKLRAPPPEPLVYADLAASPLGRWAEVFRIELEDGRVGFLSFLRGLRDPDAVRARVARIPGAQWLDQTAIFADAHRTHRERTLVGLAVGFVVVVALVGSRYRAAGPTLGAVAPAAAAVVVTVGALGALDIPLDVVGLTALLMVFSMGVDYGVFLAEAAGAPGRRGTTLLAVGVAWISTLAGFGFLALSRHPAMHTIGVVASLGLTTAVLLAPVPLVLTKRSAR